MPLLEVNNLKTCFHTRHGTVRAVDGVSFSVDRGETLGIAGESGCGKSVSQYSLLGLLPMPPAKIEGGSAMLDGMDLLRCGERTLRQVRGRRISMIFQDPMTALNPYMRIGAQVMEPLLSHGLCGKAEATLRAQRMLEAVGIQDAPRRMRMYPHEFSGGMRQRAMIAMALITEPELLIADEPTTALDVTVQAQILELIRTLQRKMGMAMILVTHDLGVLSETCQRLAVMYAGRIVETGETRSVLGGPLHPYTRALLDALPGKGASQSPLAVISGTPPDLAALPPGCAFAERCPAARPLCRREECRLQSIGRADSEPATDQTHARQTACLRALRGEWPCSEPTGEA